MKNPQISVIVLTRNRPERCTESINANQAALQPLDTEWFVINNGGIEVNLPKNIHYIRLRKNRGTGARNRAIQQAKAPYILMLDDDAFIQKETIENALKEIQKKPKTGCIILPIENEGCLLSSIFHGCAVLFDTRALIQIGGYPNDYLYYGEEYEISFRLYKAGYLFKKTPMHTAPVRHVRDASGRNKSRIIYRLIRNNTICWMRCLPKDQRFNGIYDTLLRYYYIAKKEKAIYGFWKGFLTLPIALLRGCTKRNPLRSKQFRAISRTQDIENLLNQLKNNDANIILCGFGKFPSLWIKTMQRANIHPSIILEQNSAFKGVAFRGIPIQGPETLADLIKPNTLFLTGTASDPTNSFWEQKLKDANIKAEPSDVPLKLFKT